MWWKVTVSDTLPGIDLVYTVKGELSGIEAWFKTKFGEQDRYKITDVWLIPEGMKPYEVIEQEVRSKNFLNISPHI